MKTIGLFGGTGWSSTIEYYKLLNELIHKELGGYHSAKILLKSIDYHDIITRYGKDPKEILPLFHNELVELTNLKPDSLIICCNTLHKYFDMLKNDLDITIPVFHAVSLTADHIIKNKYSKVLLLATKFTMEDGFFSDILQKSNIAVTIPNEQERNKMQEIHAELMHNRVTDSAKNYFKELVQKYDDNDAVIIGCTEWALVLNSNNSVLPIIDTLQLQCEAAVDYSLQRK